MRLAHVVHSLELTQGGLPAVVLRLAAEQARAGATVRVVTSAAPDAAMERWRESVAGLERVEIAAAPAGLQAARLAATGDVVHVHGLWRATPTLASRAALRAGRPLVISPHGMLSHWCLEHRPWRKRAALALGWRHQLRSAAVLHALTPAEARELDRLLGHRRIRVLPNGVDCAEFAAGGGVEPAPAVAGGGQGRYFLSLGRLHVVKGLDLLVEAAAVALPSLPGCRLVLAGPDDGALSALERQIARSPVADRISVVGPVYGEAKRELLAGAVALCQPSRYEAFSVAVLEALASGTPVIASPAAAVPGLQESGAGLVAAMDAEALAQAMLTIGVDPQRRASMSAAGRSLVRDCYGWDAIAARWLDLYSELLSQKMSHSVAAG